MFATLMLMTADPGRDLAVALATKLESLKVVAFAYERKLDYPGEGYAHTLKAEIYIEFGRQFNPIQARFQADGADWRRIFDGQSSFHQTNGKPAEDVILNPKAEDFDSVSPLKNSIIGLAKGLRALTSNPKITFANPAPHQFEFKLVKRELCPSGITEVGYDPTYRFTLDPRSGMPSKIVHKLAKPNDTITTTFSNWNLEASKRSASSWQAQKN